jgi:hypothetical protein
MHAVSTLMGMAGSIAWPDRAMLRKQLEIPPEAAKAFVRDMKAFFEAKGRLMQDEIAAKQAWLLKEHLPRGTKLRATEVKELFLRMRDHT